MVRVRGILHVGGVAVAEVPHKVREVCTRGLVVEEDLLAVLGLRRAEKKIGMRIARHMHHVLQRQRVTAAGLAGHDKLRGVVTLIGKRGMQRNGRIHVGVATVIVYGPVESGIVRTVLRLPSHGQRLAAVVGRVRNVDVGSWHDGHLHGGGIGHALPPVGGHHVVGATLGDRASGGKALRVGDVRCRRPLEREILRTAHLLNLHVGQRIAGDESRVAEPHAVVGLKVYDNRISFVEEIHQVGEAVAALRNNVQLGGFHLVGIGERHRGKHRHMHELHRVAGLVNELVVVNRQFHSLLGGQGVVHAQNRIAAGLDNDGGIGRDERMLNGEREIQVSAVLYQGIATLLALPSLLHHHTGAVETALLNEHAGIQSLVRDVADGQFHVVGIATENGSVGRQLGGKAIVTHTVVVITVADEILRVGRIGSRTGTTTMVAVVHVVDGHGHTVGIRRRDGARHYRHIFVARQVGHRVNTPGQQESKHIIVLGVDILAVFLGSKDVVERERVSHSDEVELQGGAIREGIPTRIRSKGRFGIRVRQRTGHIVRTSRQENAGIDRK